MDARIGQLMKDGKLVHYAMVNGYDQAPVVGTLEEIEIALGLREPSEIVVHEAIAVVTAAPANAGLIEFTVHVQKKYPAWDEVNGYDVTVWAKSKSEANRIVRDEERRACTHCGDGHVYYKATAN